MNKKEQKALKGKTVKSFTDGKMTFTDGTVLLFETYMSSYGHNDTFAAIAYKMTSEDDLAEKRRHQEWLNEPVDCPGANEQPAKHYTEKSVEGGIMVERVVSCQCARCGSFQKINKNGTPRAHKTTRGWLER